MMIRLLAFLCLSLPAIAEPVLVRDSVLTLRGDDPNFGGYSAIHVFVGGDRFLALSDRGFFQYGRFERQNGQIIAATLDSLLPILDTKSRPLDSNNIDSEGLAVAADGRIFISFESNSRVMQHLDQISPAEFLPKHPDFDALQNNSGLEALAIDGENTIYAIPERSGKLDRPFPVYRFKNDTWDTDLQIPRLPPLLVVGADVFEGELYILERHIEGIAGFSTRIRRFSIGETLTDETVLLTSKSGQFDNLEGISVWRDSAGNIRVTLISDDNFNFFQRSQIVEFILRD